MVAEISAIESDVGDQDIENGSSGPVECTDVRPVGLGDHERGAVGLVRLEAQERRSTGRRGRMSLRRRSPGPKLIRRSSRSRCARVDVAIGWDRRSGRFAAGPNGRAAGRCRRSEGDDRAGHQQMPAAAARCRSSATAAPGRKTGRRAIVLMGIHLSGNVQAGRWPRGRRLGENVVEVIRELGSPGRYASCEARSRTDRRTDRRQSFLASPGELAGSLPASASKVARSETTSRCSRDFAAPRVMPSEAAASGSGMPR